VPDWKQEILKRLATLRLAPEREAEIVEELSQHLEDRYRELLVGGATDVEARHVALEELTDRPVDELTRGLRQVERAMNQEPVVPGGGGRGNLFTSFGQDVRYGLRQLRRNPGFTIVAASTLALGIGVNTAIFSIVNLLVLRPLPIHAPEQVTFLTSQQKGGGASNNFSYPDLEEIRKQTSSTFSDVAGVQPYGMEGLSFEGKSRPMWTSYVTGNFFAMMGVQPALGRFFLPAEGQVAGADPVLVLGYSYWRTRFGGDTNIVGKTADVDGHPVTVIGVAPEGFRGISALLDTQGYLPLGMQVLDNQTASDFMSHREKKNVLVVTRLKGGVKLEAAQSTLAVVARRLSGEYPKEDRWTAVRASPLGPFGPFTDTTDPMPFVGAIFLFLAGLVLVLAGVNVANTLLVRATVRRREMAVRAALGAARARLIRQLLTESLMLGLLGCAGGIVLGLGASLVLSSVPTDSAIPIVFDFPFDWRVFSYALAAGVFAALLVGTVPALRASRSNLRDILHEGSRTSTGSGQRLRKTLVVLQVAGSLMLLIVAGLFARSLKEVQNSDLGFDANQVLNFSMDAHQAGYREPQARAFLDDLLTRVRALPGIQSASLAATVPMGYYSEGTTLQIEGYQPPPGSDNLYAGYNTVSPNYFQTMRIPLLQGRDFRNADNANAPRVAVINQAMAERFWPKGNPVGRHFSLANDPDHPVEIIGVVKNSRTSDLSGSFGAYFYLAFSQKYMLPVTLQVRAATAPETMTPQIREIIRSLEPSMPVFDVMSMSQALDTLNGLMLYRVAGGLAALFGLLGLTLAFVGVYGVVSYSAAQRTHEIGIRMALGAERGDVLRLVVGQGLWLIFIGVALGIGGALAMTRLLSSLLYGVSATDPMTFLVIPLLLAGVALVASYIPARRATKVDPMVALRYE
jgi:putative ABC transport system permease protein